MANNEYYQRDKAVKRSKKFPNKTASLPTLKAMSSVGSNIGQNNYEAREEPEDDYHTNDNHLATSFANLQPGDNPPSTSVLIDEVSTVL